MREEDKDGKVRASQPTSDSAFMEETKTVLNVVVNTVRGKDRAEEKTAQPQTATGSSA